MLEKSSAPKKAELVEMLTAGGRDEQELFRRAREARELLFGNQVVVRGVIEVTNICRVNCDYCPMRRENMSRVNSYLFRSDEIVEAAWAIRMSGLRVVFIQGGEIHETTKVVGEAIPQLKKLFNDQVEVLLCLGNKTRDEYRYLKQQGADSYILKHETSDRDLNERLRHEYFVRRLTCLEDLMSLGYRVGTGTIVGLPGQTIDSLADDILLASELKVHMASAAPFVPAEGTPLQNCEPGRLDLTLRVMATMRICEPDWLIPSVSALEKIGHDGQFLGLQAGANVLTVNFTPAALRQQYAIYGSDRYIVGLDHVKEILDRSRLQPDHLDPHE